MALTATASQGYERLHDLEKGRVFHVPGTPGTTFNEGDLCKVVVGTGLLATISAGDAPLLRVKKKTVCPAATVAMPLPKVPNFRNIDADAKWPGLVPCELVQGAGAAMYRATFASHKDDTCITYDASARSIACTTGFGTDDYPNGAMLYVYEGAGAGQINVVEDYDHTGGAAELLLICRRPFAVALDSTSKFIVVSGEAAASRGVSFFNRIDGDVNNLTANDGANDGDYVVVMDFLEAPRFLKELTLPVMSALALFAS